MATCGQKIKALIDRFHLTETEAAAKIGMTPQQLSNLIHDRYAEPRRSTLERIAAPFGVDWRELLAD